MKKEAVSRSRQFQEQVFVFETVTLDRQGSVTGRTTGHIRQGIEYLGSARVELALVAVPGGSFQMGSRHEGGYEDERPVHPVFIQPFWMGQHLITQAQWKAVTGKLPGCRFHGETLPVETISWQDAADFCARLARMTGRPYRLPSEAEWEYACRAGTITPFSLGETLTTDYANYVGLHIYRNEPQGVYRHGPTPVGSFLPNPWGLFDMHGQVWEFCADFWSPDYTGAPLDGSPRTIGFRPSSEPKDHVARGGSWHEIPGHCRSAIRLKVAEDDRMEFYGLRVALDATQSH